MTRRRWRGRVSPRALYVERRAQVVVPTPRVGLKELWVCGAKAVLCCAEGGKVKGAKFAAASK